MPVYYKGYGLYMIVVFTSPQDVIPIFAKMPIFGFLIDLPVWASNFIVV
jgi:hypothetical protein